MTGACGVKSPARCRVIIGNCYNLQASVIGAFLLPGIKYFVKLVRSDNKKAQKRRMSTLTEWHPERPAYRTLFIDGFVLTECKRHKGGWLCKIDGFFKFPAYGKRRIRKSISKEVKSKTATSLPEVAVLQTN